LTVFPKIDLTGVCGLFNVFGPKIELAGVYYLFDFGPKIEVAGVEAV